MTVTESHSARPGGGDPPAEQLPGSRRRRWRGPVLLGLGALLMGAVLVLAVLAGTYQPIQFGDESGGTFPGLPAGVGLRAVNTFGAQTGQLYVPPQSGVFTVTESVFNNGPEAVTIEAISILSPTDQENIVRGEPAWPLIPAGPVRWRLQTIGSAVKKPWNGNSVVGVSLSPRQGLVLGIPLRMSAACYTQGGWGGLDTFYVKERFLSFTHWVAVKFQPWLIMHEPASPGEPAKDLFCPAGATR